MFDDLLNSNFYQITEEKAIGRVEKLDYKYKKFYEDVEEYCKGKDIIISNLNKLLNIPKELKFRYNLYCEQPFRHARDIADFLYSKGCKYVKMKTIITYEEFDIEYSFLVLVKIYSLRLMRGISLETLISPVKLDSILYMPPEIEIIEIYKRLYLPNFHAEWKNLLMKEELLYNLIKKRVERGIIAGEDKKEREDVNIETLKYLILTGFVSRSNFVLIGEWAVNISDYVVSGGQLGIKYSQEKIQLISQNNINDNINALTIFLRGYTDYQISARQHDLHITDFRIRRYTVYINIPHEKYPEIPFLDIFNCGNFELIPYREINVANQYLFQIGNAFVLLRFLMIDLWTLKIVKRLNQISESSFRRKSKRIMFSVEYIKRSNIMEDIFGETYAGIDVDYEISKKKEYIGEKKHKPYYPILK
jgi:hypothetical protein